MKKVYNLGARWYTNVFLISCNIFQKLARHKAKRKKLKVAKLPTLVNHNF